MNTIHRIVRDDGFHQNAPARTTNPAPANLSDPSLEYLGPDCLLDRTYALDIK